MKKFKFISAIGTNDFENQLKDWFDKHQHVTIISVDHSTTHHEVPGLGQRMITHNLSALIIYQENT